MNEIEQVKPKKIRTTKDDKFITNDLSYVAFGDSITAGFNAKLPRDYPGAMIGEQGSRNHRITGLSWPSYFAQFIDESDVTFLKSYHNFGVSSSTLTDWNAFVSKKYDEIENQHLKADFEKIQDEFYDALAQANLLTITLGANDLLSEFSDYPFYTFFDKRYHEQSMQVLEHLKVKIIARIDEQVKLLINNIRSINSSVVINFVGFMMPLIQLVDSFDLRFRNAHGITYSFSHELLSWINGTLKKAVSKFKNVSYIDINDFDFWYRNRNRLASSSFDIHPNEYGYKKIAQDIFAKLVVDKKGEKIFDFNAKYKSHDENTFTPLIKINQDKDTLKKIVFGQNMTNLFTKDEMISSLEHLFNVDNLVTRTTTGINFFKTFVPSIVHSIFNSKFMTKFDDEGELQKFLTSGDNLKYIIDSVVRYRFFNLLVIRIQNIIDAEISKDINYSIDFGIVSKSLSNSFSDLENLSILVESIGKSDFFKDKQTIVKFTDLITKLIVKYITEKTNIFNDLLSSFQTYLEIDDDQMSNLFRQVFKYNNLRIAVSNVFITMRNQAESNDENYFVNLIKKSILKTLENFVDKIIHIIRTDKVVIVGILNKLTEFLRNYNFAENFIKLTRKLLTVFLADFDDKKLVLSFFGLVLNEIDFNNLGSSTFTKALSKASRSLLIDDYGLKLEAIDYFKNVLIKFFKNTPNIELTSMWFDSLFSEENMIKSPIYAVLLNYVVSPSGNFKISNKTSRKIQISKKLLTLVKIAFMALSYVYTKEKLKNPSLEYYNSIHYKNMFRLALIVLIITFNGSPTRQIFWTKSGTGLYTVIKNTMVEAVDSGIKRVANYRDSKDILMVNNNLVKSIIGNEIKNTRNDAYHEDQILVFIYLMNDLNIVNRYNTKSSFKDTLMDFIIRGYSTKKYSEQNSLQLSFDYEPIVQLDRDQKIFLLDAEQTSQLFKASASKELKKWYKSFVANNVFDASRSTMWIAERSDENIDFHLTSYDAPINIANLTLVFKNSREYVNIDAIDFFYSVAFKENQDDDWRFVKVDKNGVGQVNNFITQKIVFNRSVYEIKISFYKDLQPKFVSIQSLSVDVFEEAISSDLSGVEVDVKKKRWWLI